VSNDFFGCINSSYKTRKPRPKGRGGGQEFVLET